MPYFVYPFMLMDVSIVTDPINPFGLLWIMLILTFMSKFFIWMYIFNSLQYIPEVELMDYMVTLWLTFWEIARPFPKELHHLTFSLKRFISFNFFTPLPTLATLCLIIAILEGMKWYLIVLLIFIFLFINDIFIDHLDLFLWKKVIWKKESKLLPIF